MTTTLNLKDANKRIQNCEEQIQELEKKIKSVTEWRNRDKNAMQSTTLRDMLMNFTEQIDIHKIYLQDLKHLQSMIVKYEEALEN